VALVKSVSKMDKLEMAGRRRGARDADRDENQPTGMARLRPARGGHLLVPHQGTSREGL